MAEAGGEAKGIDRHMGRTIDEWPDWRLEDWPEVRPLLAGTEWDQYGPYGMMGDSSGREALALLDGLRLRGGDPEPRHSVDGDSMVYERLHELDTGLMFIEPHPDMEGGEYGKLHRLFEDFHVALPFTEGERRWLYRQVSQGHPGYLHDFAGQTDRIMEGGMMREVNGGDLVRRWRAWRREDDEFAGQNSLDRAMRALSDISHRLILKENWPEDYAHLREPRAPSAPQS
jgi:hypothetical protein